MVDLIEKDFNAFFEVPFQAYGSDTTYVSPLKSDLRKMLDPAKNPLFKDGAPFTFFVAKRDGRPLGRIVLHEHAASNRTYSTRRASFGFFDCADDGDVAHALLSKAEAWAKDHGFSELVGNFNLTAMQQMGVQTDHFERKPFTDMMVNPSHIPVLLATNGFEPFFPVTTFELDLAKSKAPKADLDEHLTFAPIQKRTFAERMEEARLVLNDGFANNPMFVPLTSEEFVFQAGEMMSIIDPRLSSVLKDGDDPVGVVICIPDLNGFLKDTKSRFTLLTPFHFLKYRFRRRRAVIIFYSVAQKAHGQGLMSAILARTLRQLRAARYETLGITWIADQNLASLRMMEKIGAEPLHRLHLFRKGLT